jgi:hypothetical protein
MKTGSQIEGFWNVQPHIKKVSFPSKGKITIDLEDGRTIFAPISQFPSIKKLTLKQRGKWYLFGNGFSFDDCNEVFHIEQILGNFNEYRHESQAGN